MSILTPSRGDFQPVKTTLHNNPLFAPVHHPSPSSTAVIPLGEMYTKTSRSSNNVMDNHGHSRSTIKTGSGSGVAHDGHFDVFNTWRKGVAGTQHATTPREALASVNTNVVGNGIGSGAKSRSGLSASVASTSTLIPRPSATLDVFAADGSSRKSGLYSAQTLSMSRNVSVGAGGGKRSRERERDRDQTVILTKRAKVEAAEMVTAASVSNSNKAGRLGEEQWREKWTRAFPNLIFHFEIGAEEGPGRHLRSRVIRMGAKVDQFFSTRVTHLVVKGGASPQKARPLAPSRRGDNVISQSPKNPFLDGTGVTDLVHKAEAMNMKVWTVKKLAEILSKIAPIEATNNDTLSTLLEDERIHGTRERDLSAPRPDYYYFKPGNKYLLVEDATGRHRTIMVKEYSYNLKEGPEWPILYDGFLRVSSSMQSTVPVEKVRDRAWTLYVERRPFEGEQSPHELKRSTSLRALPSTPKLPEAQPYHDASGNSVVLTSNIASTSAANTPNFGGLNGIGHSKDRAIMQMSKRVQVLKGNARLAAARKTPNSVDYSSLSTSTSTIPERRHSMGNGFTPPPKTFMTQEQVIKMLQQAREPVHDPSVTVQARMRNREKVDMGLKGRDQDTAAGYCENCRLRYSDLSVHMASKKHRRFATNDENFEDLDRLLYTLQRPLHPSSVNMRYPPCTDRHEKDADCHKCCVDMASDDGVENDSGSASGTSDSEGEGETGDDYEEEAEEEGTDMIGDEEDDL
ncbi:hypothetical protein IAR55_003006 [Kwoniella newhampshirensis]|uniref:DBF4-type domain-containing protein n=1 Tax=Kwoniella newhampshirensis TaxID=1651941 RepID=A0AAW0YPK3_9TREE